MNPLSLFIIGLILSLIFLYLFIKFSDELILDYPSKRSSHNKPILSSGGISFVLISTVYGFLNSNYVFLKCFPLAIIGLLDDKFKLPSSIRFLVQAVTICVLFSSSNIFFYILNSKNLYYLLILIFILGGIAIINFINFMDGLDGLVAGCMIVIFLFVSLKTNTNLYILIGSLIGFIFYNWSPAKIFMGDAGSTFLGGVYAALIFKSGNILELSNIIIPSSPLLLDSITCLLRRLFRRQNIFSAHKLHLYQRLHQSGWSHRKVSFMYILMTLIISLSQIFFNLYITTILISCVFIYGIYLDKFEAIKFDL